MLQGLKSTEYSFSVSLAYFIVLYGDFKIGNMFIVLSYNNVIVENHKE